MTEKFWLNSNNVLYAILDNQPQYLPYVSISRVEWLVGDPRKAARSTMVIQGMLLQASQLFGLENGITLEVLHYEWGNRSEYDTKKVIARFSNGEILNWWIEDLVIVRIEETEAITLSVKIQADFLILEPDDY